MDKVVTVESAGNGIRVELVLRTFWLGKTVYPSVPVLRIYYRGCQVVADAPLMLDAHQCLFAMEFSSVEKRRAEIDPGCARQKIVGLRKRGGAGREFSITLRLADFMFFSHLSRASHGQPVQTGVLPFADTCSVVSIADHAPLVAYIGAGAMAAGWKKNESFHLAVFDRPGKLAETRFDLHKACPPLSIESGADGCRMLYTLLPFCAVAPETAVYSDDMRLSYRRAFERLLDHYSSEDEDFWVMRGDPGVFVVAARRQSSNWIVCGLTDKARTLTLRFEELWMRLPAEKRWLRWSAAIQRDPVLDEPDHVVVERFNGLAPDIRIALDIKKNGGFIIEFTPAAELK